MAVPIRTVNSWEIEDVDQIIDVRSPAEFRTDHIPGALNLYVLSDQQHHTVGKTYKKSPFEAKKLGASFVLSNISRHLEALFRHNSKEFHPLFYCARGGQRSKSFATICAEVGWQCSILDGGYKSYRSQVLRDLEVFSEKLEIIIISGRTGTGKTKILEELGKRGENIIDLEQLARHRGSLLGSFPELEQPQQKLFETLLCDKIKKLKFGNKVFIEAESSKIGNVQIPTPLWRAMRRSPQILIKSDQDSRANYLLDQYGSLKKNPEVLFELFRFLERSGLNAIAKKCHAFVTARDWISLAKLLLQSHYDKRYDRSMKGCGRQTILEIELPALNQMAFRSIADQISNIRLVKTKNSHQ